MSQHPCLSCGACCAHYRVSFHWSETLSESFGVPVDLTAELSPHRNVMKGTDQSAPRCAAFIGVVGAAAACSIYQNRPGCCRDFKASYENGEVSRSCDEARIASGMQTLILSDWMYRQSTTPLTP